MIHRFYGINLSEIQLSGLEAHGLPASGGLPFKEDVISHPYPVALLDVDPDFLAKAPFLQRG